MTFISIVVPVYNRERFIGRALESCLGQDFGDFEIIVIDDGSTDESVAVVRQYDDPRIRLIMHGVNLGVSAARNAGAEAASGDWVLCLDSDDELLPGALSVIHRRAVQVPDDIGGLRFMCRMDDGKLSPNPPLRQETWDYRRYITWAESVSGTQGETLVVVRRSTFRQVKYPPGRSTMLLYHLDFAQRFLTHQFPDIVRLYHQDADNRITEPSPHRRLVESPERAQSMQALLTRHGSTLASLAPQLHFAVTFKLAFHQFLSGWRLKGLQSAGSCLRRMPLFPRTWALVALGLLGPTALVWVASLRERRRGA